MVNLSEIRAALQKRWLHSHEEDTDSLMVYRPATHSFPRSRGRMGFELRPDNTLIEVGIAPTDGPRESQGTWELQDGDSPSLALKPASGAARTLRIVSVDDDRLAVEKSV